MSVINSAIRGIEMPRLNALNRQPENFDYARPTQFRFQILKIPNVEYFTTEVNLPGIAFSGDAIMNTRYTAMPFMGDTINFSPLELQFIVQEDLANWKEIYDWMTGIGFPKDNKQFENAINQGNEDNPKPNTTKGNVANPSVLTTDGTLTILTNKNNPVLQVNFRNMYPTSLSGLQYDTKDEGATQLTASVTFNYDIYEIVTL